MHIDDMRVLATTWSRTLLDRVSPMSSYRPLVEAMGLDSVLKPPATEEDILAAETRLGVRLPPSYRAFLLVSNGAYTYDDGPLDYGEDENGGLLSVQRIVPVREGDPEWVELWCGEDWGDIARHELPPPDKPVAVSDYPRSADALLIARHPRFGSLTQLLVPREGHEEWELWDTGSSGATAWRSFADYLRHDSARVPVRAFPSPPVLAEQLRESPWLDREALLWLAEEAPGLGVAVAVERTLTPDARWSDRVQAAELLGRLHELGYEADLQPVVRLSQEETPARPTALAVLARLGEADARSELEEMVLAGQTTEAWMALQRLRPLGTGRQTGGRI